MISLSFVKSGGGGTLSLVRGQEARKAGGQASIGERSSLNTKFFSCIRKFISVLSSRERVRERADFGSLEGKRSRCHAIIGRHSPRKNKFLPLLRKVRMGFKEFQPHPNPLLEKEREINSSKRTYRPNVLTSYRLKKCAFTLAEVLVTLGIIGVVAALTLPSLIEQHKKQVVAAHLQKFYSTMNQALKMAEYENGDKSLWIDRDSSITDSIQRQKVWFEKYLGKDLKIIKTEYIGWGSTLYYLSDGGGILSPGGGADWYYAPRNPEKCFNQSKEELAGTCAWVFYFSSTSKGFDTYAYGWNGTVEDLYDNPTFGCNTFASNKYYCTRLIQVNGWKIPDDYPLKIRY